VRKLHGGWLSTVAERKREREKERKKQKLVHDDPNFSAVISQEELDMYTLTLMDTEERKKIEVAW
jgi:hypothetical protein